MDIFVCLPPPALQLFRWLFLHILIPSCCSDDVAMLFISWMFQVLLGKSHFMSTHAQFGLATLILSALMPLGGLLSFKKVGLLQKLPERLQPHVKTMHRTVRLGDRRVCVLSVQDLHLSVSVFICGLSLFMTHHQ